MRRQFNPLWLLICGALPGCMSNPPLAMTAAKPAGVILGEQPSQDVFDLEDPADRQRMLDSGIHEAVNIMIADTPEGSQVSIVADDQQYTGTYVKESGNRIALLNCICKEAVPGPDGAQQCKTSHVPMQSFAINELSRFSAFAPPDPDFKKPDIHEDSGSVMISEIVFRDGKSWALSAARGESAPPANAKVDD